MPIKSSNQKLKLLYLEQLFKETDRENALTLAQLIHKLDLSGISASDKNAAR